MEGPKPPYYRLAWIHVLRHYNGQLQTAQNYSYYNHALRPLHIHYNGPLWRAPNPLTTDLLGVIYLGIIMDSYREPKTTLTIALHGDFYIAIVMDRY
jgi:hypothetical protein